MIPCAHGMPTPKACIDCMDEGNLEVAPNPPAPSVVATFIAKHDGQCGGCNLPICVGQRIARFSDQTYQHEGCAA